MSKEITNIPSKGTLSPRPYARLLTMIGDQLIKNEKIALFELIKNSYDADADWVQVRLVNFKEIRNEKKELIDVEIQSNSKIEIEDNGNGMPWKVISEAWMNPASPIKFLEKQKGNRRSDRKKRIIQGEKGIGRYAVFKMGSTVEIVTKSIEKNTPEIFLKSDLSKYDEEIFTEKTDKNKRVQYLDEIKYDYELRDKPKDIIQKKFIFQNAKKDRDPFGTIITITNLKKGAFDLNRIDEIIDDVSKLSSPFADKDIKGDFEFDLLINDASRYKKDEFKDRLESALEKAPLKVTDGKFNKDRFKFKLNNRPIEIDLTRLKEIKAFRDRFIDKQTKEIKRLPECGPFNFEFYIFDLTKDAPPKYYIEKNDDDREFIRKHRIYLFRDNVRVYPYGDYSDDWLNIDIRRGLTRAGDFLSNDQTIGYIGISNEANPNLKDKTNREGLLEIGNSYEDFIAIIQSLLGFLHGEFVKYRSSIKNKKQIEDIKKGEVPHQLELFRDYLSDKIEPKKKKEFDELVTKYQAERKYLVEKVETSEDLAAVGLSVEAASHDLMTMMHHAKETLDTLIRMSNNKDIDRIKLQEELSKIRGQITYIEDQLKGIQPIFRSSKRRKKPHRVSDIINTVKKYYDVVLDKYKIEFKLEQIGTPLVVKTNEGVLLQAFINLLDNAVYWLTTVDRKDKKILIKIDGNKYEVSFSDNGPGIQKDDEEFIFEPFFSTKGDPGRGLGLYIARQLLERNDFSIRYEKTKKLLSGANFVVDFNSEED